MSPGSIYPGDIFRLEVTRACNEFARFQMEVPQVEKLHLISIEESPLRLVNGNYLQKETWIFQSDSSGEIVLEDIKAEVTRGNLAESIQLPPITVVISPYPGQDVSSEPITIDDIAGSEDTIGYGVYFLIILIAVVPLYIFLQVRRKKRLAVIEPQPESPLETIIAELQRGNISPQSLSCYYEDERNKSGLDANLREKIENAIYAGRGDPQELAELLRKEAGK